MDYAVINIKNNQYLVKPGSKISILGELGKEGDEISAETLMVKDKNIEIGTPTVDYPIKLKVVKITKTEKIDIFTYKAKSRLRRHNGHRQFQTILEVIDSTKKPAKTEKPEKAAKAVKAEKTEKSVTKKK